MSKSEHDMSETDDINRNQVLKPKTENRKSKSKSRCVEQPQTSDDLYRDVTPTDSSDRQQASTSRSEKKRPACNHNSPSICGLFESKPERKCAKRRKSVRRSIKSCKRIKKVPIRKRACKRRCRPKKGGGNTLSNIIKAVKSSLYGLSGRKKKFAPPGKVSKNPFFNYLRTFRMDFLRPDVVEVAVKGAKKWRSMSKKQKIPYYVAAQTAVKPPLRRVHSKTLYW